MAVVSYAFVTLAEVKTRLDISGTSEDDKLNELINSATDLLERYCGRRFKQTQYTEEVYGGENTNRLFLRNYPISDELADAPVVLIDDVAVEIEAIDYPRGIIELESIANDDMSNVKVTHKSGYAAADIPHDLKEAIFLLVSGARNVGKSSGISSESVGDYSVTYASVHGVFSQSVKQLVINFKRF